MPAFPTTRLSALLPLILPYVQHCPEPYALFQARLAAIEFCEKTRCWRHVVTLPMTAHTTMIFAPMSATIHEFEDVTYDGEPLTPVQYTEADPDALTGIAEGGNPRWITQVAPGEVSVFPFVPGTLRASVFLKPRHGQQFGTDLSDPLHDAFNVIPDFLFAQHATQLADGALARIMLTENEPFYNPEKAAMHERKFQSACANRSGAHVRGQQRAPVRTRPNWI
jgi:hypothetical protein